MMTTFRKSQSIYRTAAIPALEFSFFPADGRGNVARGDTIVTVSEDYRRHHDRDSEEEESGRATD